MFRQLQNVKRIDLATALECDVSYLSRLESGERQPSPAFLTGLCERLGGLDRRALIVTVAAGGITTPPGDVLVNGLYLRALRVLTRAGTRAVFAAALGLSRDALTLLEARPAAPCSPAVVALAAVNFGVADRSALLADPYGVDTRVVERWHDGAELDTAPLPRVTGTSATTPPAIPAPRPGRHRSTTDVRVAAGGA